MLKEHRLNQSFDIVVLHAEINVLLLLAVAAGQTKKK